MNRKIVLLGSTGSIGRQTLDVVRHLGITVLGLAARSNYTRLEQQAREFHPRRVVIWDSACYLPLKAALADTDIEVCAGEDALCELAGEQSADLILNAIVGIAGLRSTLAAIGAHKTLALANKESLVTAGALVMQTAKANRTTILPVDSEHSAIFQCLNGGNRDRIRKVLLTASGGPFFGASRETLRQVGVADALRHPNWSMGKKVTIDSATLMNKGLELIEAMHLFDVVPQQVEILVHRQSIVHSAVEFVDGVVLAQLGIPDMRIPIQYALTWPDRMPSELPPLSLFDTGALTFERPDPETFRCLSAALEAAKRGGLAPCVVNGANEAAVELFLEGKISFLDIGELVEDTLSLAGCSQRYTVEDVGAADQMAREQVRRRACSRS